MGYGFWVLLNVPKITIKLNILDHLLIDELVMPQKLKVMLCGYLVLPFQHKALSGTKMILGIKG